MSSGSPSVESPKRHISELPDPRQRFLARVVDHTLEDGWRTPDDFLRHFPPSAIVESLANADELRVKLLVATTGTHEKIVRKKSRSSAIEDLEIALSESTTTPSALIALYPADDKVRYLNPKKLWSFVVEDQFYKATQAQDAARHARAASRLTFVLECALAEGLITLRDIADGMTFDEIAASLPVSDVRDLLKHAMQIGRASAPLTEERFLAVVPLPTLVAQVRLDHTFDRVVVERIAVPSNLTDPLPSSSGDDANDEMPNSVVDVSNDSQVEAPAPAPVIRDSVADVESEDDARDKVIEGLRAIDRLPPGSTELSTPVLLSIENMYADLWSVSDDDEREAAIRESFPNESLLRTAMLSMIELLDPSVDTKDPIIRDADVSGLIKIVLFEERRRREPSPSARRSSPAVSQRGRRSVPPPLPRSSVPPPLPGDGRASTPPPLPAEASGDKRGR